MLYILEISLNVTNTDLMDEIINHKTLLSQKSKLSMQLCRHDSGKLFIRLNQILFIPELENSIVINPNSIEEVIRMLYDFQDEINNFNHDEEALIIKQEDHQKIITTFLKGIPLEDLAL